MTREWHEIVVHPRKGNGVIQERITLDAEDSYDITAQHTSRYHFAKGFVERKRVLDSACGTGYGSAIMRHGNPLCILGIERSPETIDYEQINYGDSITEFRLGDAEQIRIREKWDIIVSFETIEHLKHPEYFIDEVKRILSPEGMLIVSTPVRPPGERPKTPRNPYHVMEWSIEEFHEFLLPHFKTVRSYYQFSLMKRWTPFSRTLKNILLKFLSPEESVELSQYRVRDTEPPNVTFECEPVYMVFTYRLTGSSVPGWSDIGSK